MRWGRADGRRNKSCSAASRPLDRRHIALRDIAYAERWRGVNEGNVNRLGGSMREVGLINPIILRPQAGIGYWLVAGLQRIEAARRLHWDSIPAIIVETNDTEARIAEIDENLMRGELSAAERAMHVTERKRLYEEAHASFFPLLHMSSAEQWIARIAKHHVALLPEAADLLFSLRLQK